MRPNRPTRLAESRARSGRLPLLAAAVAAIVGAAPAWSAEVKQPPNIVFLLADDLGWADVGFHGKDIQTPNIDKLAAAGVTLEAHYALPVCTPTRSALMTGRYPIRYGRQYNVLRPNSQVGLSLDERLLPQALRDVGYQTVICGKWHLGDFDPAYLPMARGFDHQYGFGTHGERFTHFPKREDRVLRDQRPSGDEGYMTHLVANEAIGWIDRHDTQKPLFLYVAFHAPHNPLQCPPENAASYANLGPTRSLYAGMIAAMDEDIGKIVAAIDRHKMRGNTLIVFSSDNGGLIGKGEIASNAPLRGGKGSLYEGGVRVAAFATWQGHLPAGAVVAQPVHVVDWYPTLVRLAGGKLDPKHPLDGRDIWPTIAEDKPSPHDCILLNTVGRSGAIRQGDWKLVRNGKTEDDEESSGSAAREDRQKARRTQRSAPDVCELFNLATDPGEKQDISEKHPEKMRELVSRLDEFARQAVPPILRPATSDGDASKRHTK